MKTVKKRFRVTSGIFISKEVLSKAKIDADEIELEFDDYEVRIRALKKKNKKKIFNSDSPLWKSIGCAEIEGVNGRNHDQILSDET